MPKKKIGKRTYRQNRTTKSKNLLLFFILVISFFSVFVTVNQLQKTQTITQRADTITTAVQKPIWGCLGLGNSDVCTSASDTFSMDPDSIEKCLEVKGSLKPEQVEQGQTLEFTFDISVKKAEAPVNATQSGTIDNAINCNAGFPLSALFVKATHKTKSGKTFTVEEKSTPTTLLKNSLRFLPKHKLDEKEELGEWTATLYMPGPNNTEVKFPNMPDLKFTVIEPCNKNLEVSKQIAVDKKNVTFGEDVTGSITYKNPCKGPYTVKDMLIMVTKPGAGDKITTDDFSPKTANFTFEPEAEKLIEATVTIPNKACEDKPTCTWEIFGSYKKSDNMQITEATVAPFNIGQAPVDAPVDDQNTDQGPDGGGACEKDQDCADGYTCQKLPGDKGIDDKACRKGNTPAGNIPAGGICDPDNGKNCVDGYVCGLVGDKGTDKVCKKGNASPGAAKPAPQKNAKLSQKVIYFDFDSAAIKPAYNATLDSVAQFLKTNTGTKVTLEGHTDDVGTPAYNQSLGQRRADAVKAYLAGKGIAASRFTVVSKGETQPVASNKTADGRAKNRRVEIFTP